MTFYPVVDQSSMIVLHHADADLYCSIRDVMIYKYEIINEITTKLGGYL